jgi:hypothetical protein
MNHTGTSDGTGPDCMLLFFYIFFSGAIDRDKHQELPSRSLLAAGGGFHPWGGKERYWEVHTEEMHLGTLAGLASSVGLGATAS